MKYFEKKVVCIGYFSDSKNINTNNGEIMEKGVKYET